MIAMLVSHYTRILTSVTSIMECHMSFEHCSRDIIIVCEVNDEMANVLVAQILYLANQEGAKELGEGVLFAFSWGSLNLGSIDDGGYCGCI